MMVFCNVVVPQIFWSKRCAHQHPRDVGRVDPHQRRHVVRALQHRHHLAAPGLHPLEAGRTTRRPGSTSACSSARSACSRRCSCCSSSSCRPSRSPRSRSCATSWRMIRPPIRSGRRTDERPGHDSSGFVPRRFVLAEFADAGRRCSPARRRCARRATRTSTRTRRSRSTASRRPWASSGRRSRPSFCAARSPARASRTR